MRRNVFANRFTATLGLVLFFGGAASATAQVKRVQMHIAGYLCGNWVYNIQKAVSRLDYAPKLKEIEVTDFQKGLGVFTPKPDKPVSFAALKETLKKAGYTLDAADITVAGTLTNGAKGWLLVVQPSGQKFTLEGPNVDQALAEAKEGANIEITGEWKTVGTGPNAHEAIWPARKANATVHKNSRKGFPNFAKVSFIEERAAVADPAELLTATFPFVPLAPIRVTSPGLIVYKGGAVTPRLYLIKQHLGSLEVNRQAFDLSVSYTPSPRLQLEVEVPFSRTAYDDSITSGSGSGFGNIIGWAKYRFFRKVKTYGDRQAAFRVGMELPTGKTTAPTQAQINVPAFVRQQLTPINGGFAPHFDLAFSQAGGRFIFGGNAEVIFRAERDGFRMGHEQRLNTDLEYVIPRDPRKPGGELFLILETTFVHRGTGRLNRMTVAGSKSTEYYLAPGLQYAAHPRFVVEGSFQFPVVRNTGPVVLRTDRNLLLGVKYLFWSVMRVVALTTFLLLFSVSTFAQSSPQSVELTLKDIHGRTLRLSDYKGKVVLLNFWATWCIPCRTEIPDLIQMQKKYRNQRLRIIGVTYSPVKLSEVRRFVREFKMNYPVAMGTKATKALFTSSETLPVTVVIDREGTVRDVIEGIMYADEFQQKVQPLLSKRRENNRIDKWSRSRKKALKNSTTHF